MTTAWELSLELRGTGCQNVGMTSHATPHPTDVTTPSRRGRKGRRAAERRREDRPGSRPAIANARRLVVKIGSSSLTNARGRLDVAALRRFVDAVAERHAAGTEIVVVSSGAVAAGLAPLNLDRRPRDLADVQAAASVGQGMLIGQWADAFGAYDIPAGQLLLTAEDTIRRARYRNAGRTIETMLRMGAVPIINENDALVADELRFGDNDRLAALVSHLIRADALILLTDVDGLYDGPPTRPGATRIREVRSLDEIADVDVGGTGSSVGTGGMVTKLQSAAIAMDSGIPVVLTTAENARGALAGEAVGTMFHATGKRRARRHLWLQHAARADEAITVDAGAAEALKTGRASLLAAGILHVGPGLVAGDPVAIRDALGVEIARGIAAFDAEEIERMAGKQTVELAASLGEQYARPVVHLDDLVLVDAPFGGDGTE